jgi:hypothetical protein
MVYALLYACLMRIVRSLRAAVAWLCLPGLVLVRLVRRLLLPQSTPDLPRPDLSQRVITSFTRWVRTRMLCLTYTCHQLDRRGCYDTS